MAELRTFGTANLVLPDRIVGSGKAAALLAYLSAAPTRSARRKDVFQLLYSNDSPREADAFRQLLVSLRKLFPGTFATTGDVVQLTDAVPSDRHAFLDAVTRADFDAAVAMYVGEFFDSFDERGCDGFRRWAHEERQRLRRHFEFAAECAVRHQLARAEWTIALATAKRIAERFPAYAVSARLVIETLVLAGRAAEARPMLTELGILTSDAGQASQTDNIDVLFEAVTDLAREYGLADTRRPMIGREAAYGAMVEAWNTVCSGEGATILLTGTPGQGKSRLLKNFALRLRLDTPAIVGPITCGGTTESPNSLAGQIASGILRLRGAIGTAPTHFLVLERLAGGAPLGTDVGSDETINTIVDALSDGLRATSEEAPLAILIDDVDATGDASQRIVAELAVRLRTANVLFVLASQQELTGSITTSPRRRITLSDLSAQEARTLLGCALGSVSDAEIAAIHSMPHGTPREILAAVDHPVNIAPHETCVSVQGSSVERATVPRARGQSSERHSMTRLRSRTMLVGAISASVLFSVVGAFRIARADEMRESFTVFTWDGTSVSRESFTIGDEAADALTPGIITETATSRWPFERVPDRLRIAPDGITIAVQTETDGPNTMDIMGVRGDSAFPLITGPRDDATPDWSPDGGMLAFSTNRWSAVGNEGCDIAVKHIATQEIWRVTAGPDCDYLPRWSIDGRGVAFVRQFRAQGARAAICSTERIGLPFQCTTIDSTLQVVDLLGWRTASTLLYVATVGSDAAIHQLDLSTGKSTRLIDGLTLVAAELSPSRKYVACWCSTTSDVARRITLFDLSGKRPLLARGVPPDVPFRHIAWHAREHASADDLASRTAALRQIDRSLRSGTVSTQPADTLVAARTMMRAAAAGVRRAMKAAPMPAFPRDSFDARGSDQPPIVDEAWNFIDTVRWRPFGSPRPRASAAIRGLDPGGDGSYVSGLYLREAFAAPYGFVVEAHVTIPVSLPYWQGLTVFVESESYVRNMQRWKLDLTRFGGHPA